MSTQVPLLQDTPRQSSMSRRTFMQWQGVKRYRQYIYLLITSSVCRTKTWVSISSCSIFTQFNRSLIITARRRSLGQVNVFTGVCQSFCPQGGVCLRVWGCLPLGWGACLCACGCLLLDPGVCGRHTLDTNPQAQPLDTPGHTPSWTHSLRTQIDTNT